VNSAAPPGLADLARLAEPTVIADPYPLLARLREASPFTEFNGAMVVLGRYQDCSRILRDPRASSERDRSLLAPPGQSSVAARTRSFLSLDPPDHTRLRRLVAKAFTPRVVATLEPRIRAVTDELISAAALADGPVADGPAADGPAADGPAADGPAADGPAADGPAVDQHSIELVSQLAYPLPVRIISELLGVPPVDHARFAAWSAKLAHSVQPQFGPVEAAELAAAEQASQEFGGYFSELIAARRADPASDLLTSLIRAEDEGERLTQDELIATCVLLLVAGHETTAGLISNAVLALLRHRDELAALQADPGLAASAVEETLRYDPPVQLTGRVARNGITIDGVNAPDGAVLLLLLAATGRDPQTFTDPDAFRIRRGQREHLAFGAGAHFCLGAPLARLEATIALQSIATRLTNPELDEDALIYKPNFNLRGPQRLVLTFDRIERRRAP
jgi:cytochrome P450